MKQSSKAGFWAALLVTSFGVAILSWGLWKYLQDPNVIPSSYFRAEYQGTNEYFPNPDRGFTGQESTENTAEPLSPQTLASLRTQGITLLRRLYVLSDFRNRPLSAELLTFIKRDVEVALAAGIRLIPRFSYNQDAKGQDAPQEIILSHIKQLKILFHESKDGILAVEAGFIGTWGEWHDSTNGLNDESSKRTILEALLNAVSNDRIVLIRPGDMKPALFHNTAPLESKSAALRDGRARTGHHNDCFLADETDMGTFWPNDPTEILRKKQFLSADNLYTAQGGETCAPHTDRTACPVALKELELERWTYLNSLYHPQVIQRWKNDGCWEMIGRRLGYRLRLLETAFPPVAKAGSNINFHFRLVNEGFAPPINPRTVFLRFELMNSRTPAVVVPLDLNPRNWQPGKELKLRSPVSVPDELIPGEYHLALWLPDASEGLQMRSEFSIRFANQGMWDKASGSNRLQGTLRITGP